MTILNVEKTIARLKQGHLEAVLKKAGAIVPIQAGHINTLVRACLVAPPGKLLAVADFSQVEARNLAWAAGDHDALAIFALYDSGDHDNGDPYAAMAAQIFGGKPREFVKGSAGEYPGRHIGKQAELGCLSKFTYVKTRRGWVLLPLVRHTDLLWDGLEWVHHAGVVHSGKRHCVNVDGIFLTPDHLMLCGENWVEAYLLSARPDLVECETYDIVNAGPQNRFTVWGWRGERVVHNCGYGMGAKKFHQKVIDDGGSWADIIEAAGQTGVLAPEDMAEAVVDAWRTKHAPIVAFWRELQNAAIEVTEGGAGASASAGPYTWQNVDGLVLCELPSGRALCYRGMRTDPDEYDRPSLSYVGRKGRERTYGGKLAENVTQAACRDLLAEVIIRAEAEGLCPCHTIHDEPICEVPEAEAEDALALLVEIMHIVPAWCKGMPIAAEGLPLSRRYGK